MNLSHEQRMDLKNDFAFKQMFGQPHHAKFLIAFLNALFRRQGVDKIVSIQFPNTELTAEAIGDKESRLDIFAVTDTDEQINVEIQLSNQKDMVQRSLYYWSSLFRNQAKTGLKYRNLNRTITVNILDFSLFHSTQRYHTTYHVREDDAQLLLSDILEIHFVELPKLRKAYQGHVTSAVLDPLERWLLLLDASNNKNIISELEAVAMDDPIMEQALEAWEQISRDPDNWVAYVHRHMALMDKASWLENAREDGWESGKLEGRQEGEISKSIEIARNLLLMGIPTDDVVIATGLERHQVEYLV